MEFQGRAIEPMFTRNVNGEKKLTFKMYKQFIDTATGEKVSNPFSDWLINERKVRLYYENNWHDFLIKNVTENTSNYLYTYSLVDAYANELLKNGFGITLDTELENNMGTAKELAERVLEETDWEVESEIFVQTIEEPLVYLKVKSGWKSSDVYKIYDQTEDKSKGVKIKNFEQDIPKDATILAFYSSCTGKPHLFQFIYLDNYELENISRDENRNILTKNCQFFIKLDPTDYSQQKEEKYGFYLPPNVELLATSNNYLNDEDSTISSWYRARKYSFSIQAEYLPGLKKTVNLYTGPEYKYQDSEGEHISNEYYGYQEAKYVSPIVVSNVLSNSDFNNGRDGWFVGTTYSSSTYQAPEAAAVFGKFESGKFKSSIDLFKEDKGTNYTTCSSYLEVKLGVGDIILNSGPTDFKNKIQNMVPGDRWEYEATIYDNKGAKVSTLDCFEAVLGEFQNSGTQYYKNDSNIDIQTKGTGFEIVSSNYTNNTFARNSKVRFGLIAKKAGTYYIETAKLYQLIVIINDKGEIELIKPDSEGANYYIGKTKIIYKYFQKFGINYLGLEDINYSQQTDVLSYKTYEPIYNTNAEKVRSINAKESNYFNILQSLAEAFDAWLDLKMVRDQSGTVLRKIASFKNYIGQENPAGLKYGVNLQNIERICQTNQIVNKLIVRPNSNELAENGICSISQASANETGEDYIYDFQYYFNKGLMDVSDYLDTVYSYEGAEGKDLNEDSENWRLNGYNPRIKNLNNQIREAEDNYININSDYITLLSNQTLAENRLEAARHALEDSEQLINSLLGMSVIFADNSSRINSSVGRNSLKPYKVDNFANYPTSIYVENESILPTQDTTLKVWKWTFTLKIGYTPSKDELFNGYVQFKNLQYQDGSTLTDALYSIKGTIRAKERTGTMELVIPYGPADSMKDKNGEIYKTIQEYAINKKIEENSNAELDSISLQVTELEQKLRELNSKITILKEYKTRLNGLFYDKYSAYIQEGVWLSEDYIDHNKYYIDALSVLYNSCYPQVSYNITPSKTDFEGSEYFDQKIGDKTFVEDIEFFGIDELGNPIRTEIVITEKSDNLDKQDNTTIKVQNFKNEFQDLFQKITATVQQAQYKSGSYEKAVALVEANAEKKNEFLSDALSSANAIFSAAGQQSVVQGIDGIIITDLKTPSNQIKMVGGAIMISRSDGYGNQRWSTAITGKGISANAINSGTINASEISIMNGNDASFRWDAFGISAYGTEERVGSNIINTNQFVRVDKYGIYGITGLDGTSWHPNRQEEIDEKSTFSLTWSGLKVVGNEQTVLRIGKLNNYIIKITDAQGKVVFSVQNDGTTLIGGCNVQDGALVVDSINLAENSVSTYQLAASSVDTDQIVDNAVTYNKINVDSLSAISADIGTITTGIIRSRSRMQIDITNGEIIFANFSVSPEGNITATAGTIGGWEIGETSLHTADNALYFGSAGLNATINGTTEDDFIFKAGTGFGVTSDGKMYATTGSIGPWSLTHEGLSYTSTQGQTLYGSQKFTLISWDDEFSAGVTFGVKYRPDGTTTERRTFTIYGAYLQNCISSNDLSDVRYKNSIETLGEYYEQFYDKIEPVRYKYNDGTSGRYHTGFLAQSLVNALNESGLSTQEFAGVLLKTDDDGNERWHLRRDEFVALNTWQIQKLKARVSDLEKQIADYETRLSKLELKI